VVELVYLDPPFNSNASYNVLFAEQDGARSAAQISAFKDTWRWDASGGSLSRVQSYGVWPL
jgi:site-specific DNA-methyltransferase (adenine-specific)